MRKLRLTLAVLFLFAILGTAHAQRNPNLRELRVGRDDATRMRKKQKNGNGNAELFKISREDLEALIELASTQKAANDSFVFFLVKYTGSTAEKKRFKDKLSQDSKAGDTYDEVVRKNATGVLVGFQSGNNLATGWLLSPRINRGIAVYDMAVLCPPPPDCDCEIAQ